MPTNAEILSQIQNIERSIDRALREFNMQVARGNGIIEDGHGSPLQRIREADQRISALRAQIQS